MWIGVALGAGGGLLLALLFFWQYRTVTKDLQQAMKDNNRLIERNVRLEQSNKEFQDATSRLQSRQNAIKRALQVAEEQVSFLLVELEKPPSERNTSNLIRSELDRLRKEVSGS